MKDYTPFMPLDDVYTDDKGLTLHRVLQAFSYFGISPAVVSSDFKALLRELADKEYPNFRCSAARAVLEGRLPGVPKPVSLIHPGWKKKVQQLLYLMDAMETIVCLHIEKQLKEMRPDILKQVRSVTRAVGNTKVPRLWEEVFEIEPEDLPKIKTGKKKGRRKKVG